jgi:hypothetical protein
MASISNVGDEGIQSLVASRPQRLKQLTLNHTDITVAGARHLTKLANLRSVNLCQTKTTEMSLQYLSECPNLEHLDIGQLVRVPIGSATLAHSSSTVPSSALLTLTLPKVMNT